MLRILCNVLNVSVFVFCVSNTFPNTFNNGKYRKLHCACSPGDITRLSSLKDRYKSRTENLSESMRRLFLIMPRDLLKDAFRLTSCWYILFVVRTVAHEIVHNLSQVPLTLSILLLLIPLHCLFISALSCIGDFDWFAFKSWETGKLEGESHRLGASCNSDADKWLCRTGMNHMNFSKSYLFPHSRVASRSWDKPVTLASVFFWHALVSKAGMRHCR